MRIIVDIGHPAHAHYFKNFIRLMEKSGHEFRVIARDKEITHKLLGALNINYISRGKGGGNLVAKLLYALRADYIIYKVARKFKPDFMLSFASPYCAHISRLLGITHIGVTDTEHAKLGLLAFVPFTDIILTPTFFNKDLGSKQKRFNAFVESSYLHPKYFLPDINVVKSLLGENFKPYAVLRFISWNASHDIGIKGLNAAEKLELVNMVAKRFEVYISSESELPPELEKHKLKVPPEKLHDVLAFSSVYIGEGGTTANECAILGVPNVLINPLAKFAGAFTTLKEKYGLQYYFDNFNDALPTIRHLLASESQSQGMKEKRDKMLADTIDFTEFLMAIVTGEFERKKQPTESKI